MNQKYVKNPPPKTRYVKPEPFSESQVMICGFCGWGIKQAADGGWVHASSLGERACDNMPPIVSARKASQ